MKKRFQKWLPKPEALRANRWLNWMGPRLYHPRLWHWSRKGISLGLALGIFFGLLVPVAQMPLAAGSALLLRANLPMAVASTLVTNPVTFGPVYYAAYRLGKFVLGEEPASEQQAAKLLKEAQAEPENRGETGWAERLRQWMSRLGGVGKPLVVGLAITASASGLLVYFITSAIWALVVRRNRSQRLTLRATKKPAPEPDT